MKRRILFLVASDYEDLTKKGVIHLLKEREEGGFFERVVTIHPWANHNRVLDLTAVHRLIEFKEYYLPFCKRWKLLRYPHHLVHFLRLLIAIPRIMAKEQITLVRATDPAQTGFLAFVLNILRPTPWCVSIHTDYDKRFELDSDRGALTVLGSRRLGKSIERFVVRRAPRSLPIRESLARKILSWGVPPDRVRVIPHGIDPLPFVAAADSAWRTTFSIDPGADVVSFIGRLARENYVDDVAKLALALHQQGVSNAVIVMAGDGPEREQLERFSREHQLERRLRLIGFQNPETVAAIRRDSAVALSLMGGFSLIEACAAGRPVIAYNVEWHGELVIDGKTGYLLKEGDQGGLLQKVRYLLDHRDEADRMGAAARALALEHHDLRRTSEIKKRCYEELLAQYA